MVNALQRAHGWLRPTGYLVDVRPTAEPAHLEVQLAAGIVSVGRVSDINDQIGPNARHARADVALAAAVARGWFVPEAQRELSFHRHADSVEEIRDHVHGKWMGAALDEPSLQRAAALQISEPRARLWIREQVGIVRLRPLGSGPRTVSQV
jgi:hypothetical protein